MIPCHETWHQTLYRYDRPVSYSLQRLLLDARPPSTAQKVVSWAIEAPGIEQALSYVDGFGNRVHLITAKRPARRSVDRRRGHGR